MVVARINFLMYFKKKGILIILLISLSLHADGFCTTSNLLQYCGVNSLEFKIDSAKISPALNCEKIFFWIPPFTASGEEKCYICADRSNLNTLEAIYTKGNSKRCGKIILATKL